MTSSAIEHQLNRLIFDDIERFMAALDAPKGLSKQNLTPKPFIATVNDIDIGFIGLFRHTGPGRAVALVIQYTVKIVGTVAVSLVRNSRDPAYGMLHCRKAQAAADLAHLQATLTAPRDYREMTAAEIGQFSDAAVAGGRGLDKKQIRIVPA